MENVRVRWERKIVKKIDFVSKIYDCYDESFIQCMHNLSAPFRVDNRSSFYRVNVNLLE